MTWVIASSFLSYTPTATSELTGYSAAKLPILDEHPYLRAWRSNNQVSQQDIICDLASSQVIAGVALLNCNCATVQLAHSADNVSYTDVSGSPFTVSAHWAYRRIFVPFSATKRYVRVRLPAQTPTDGAAFFELGSLVIIPSLIALPRAPRIGMQERPVREYDVSGRMRRAAGPWRLEQDWEFVYSEANVPTLRTLALLGEQQPFLVAETNAVTPKVGLYTYEGAISFDRQIRYENAKINVKELA